MCAESAYEKTFGMRSKWSLLLLSKLTTGGTRKFETIPSSAGMVSTRQANNSLSANLDTRCTGLEFLQLNTTTETCLSIISLDYPAHLSVHLALSTPATQQLLATPGFSFVGAATEEQSVSAYYKVQMRGTGELVVTAYGIHSADAHCIGMYINHVVHLRVIDKEPRVTST